jgi:hypothetical protein
MIMAKNKFILKPFEWLIAVIVCIAVLSWIIPKLRRSTQAPYPFNKLDKVMVQIYNEMLTGKSKEKIISEFSNKEQKLIKEMDVAWEPTYLFVDTPKGILNYKFLPEVNHIVLYATIGNKQSHQKSTVIFYSASGEKSSAYPEKFQKYFLITKFGTEQLLKSKNFELTTIHEDFEEEQKTQLTCYIILRLLIENDVSFVKKAIELASKGDYRTNGWLVKLLKASIISPSLPELYSKLDNNPIFVNALSDWYKENIGKINFTNRFLFEE